MTHTVMGLFDNRSEAQAAMQELVQQGFTQDNIDLSNRRMVDNTDTGVSGGDYTPDTVSTGTGDYSSGSSTSTGSSGGGIGGFFNSLFGDDETTASNYTNAANDADAILTVHVDSDERARLAAEILDRNGAIDVDERGAQYSQQNYADQSYNQQSSSQTDYSKQNYSNTEGERAIPVIEEQLNVGKQEVERGGARIRSRVIERPVEEHIRLREEHVVVNRRPVNRDVTDADLNNFREGEIDITERAEVPVVNKQAHVVEEVVLGKEVTEREEVIRDTVRRTVVDVQETDTDVTTSDINSRRANN